MSVFNRLVTVLLLLLLLALVIVVVVFPTGAFETGQRTLASAGQWLRTWENSNYWLFLTGRVLVLLLALVVFGLLLWQEVRPTRPKTIRVKMEGGSRAEVTADSVARRLAWQIDQLADVVSVTPQVTSRGKSVDVMLDLQTTPDIDVPMKTTEVVNCAREIIVDRMGLTLGKIQVRISHAPYREEV